MLTKYLHKSFQWNPSQRINFKRTFKHISRNDKDHHYIGLLQHSFEEQNIEVTRDWKQLKENILNNKANRQINSKNIDAMIIGLCTTLKKYDLGENYLNFLNDQNIKPNLATIGKYLKLLYSKSKDTGCSSGDEKQILSIYSELRKRYDVLDSLTLENIIMGLSVTREWHKCTDLLNEVKISAIPSSASYSATVSAAFKNNEEELAWRLLNELLDNNRYPQEDTFVSYFQILKRLKKNKNSFLEKLEKLFYFCQENNLNFDADVSRHFTILLKDVGLQFNSTMINFRGNCGSCKQKLKNFELTTEEFTNLKTSILKNVIVGKDLFIKTNPEELSRFQKFVSNMPEFDVVLDGLNIAYSAGTKHSPQVFSGFVSSVVAHFVKQEKKVLVLGRVHMNRWPAQNWNYIKNNATVFLTQNISQDDPYLLYCALHAGKDTIIVTRDLMRSHKFRLEDRKMKMLFNKWLLQRKYELLRVNDDHVPIFKTPLPFIRTMQKTRNYWHVPIETESSNTNERSNWLCINC